MPDGTNVVSRADEINHKGALLFGQGQMEAAKVHFLAALSLEPRNHQVLMNLGAVARNYMLYDLAASFARRALKESPDNWAILLNLGTAYMGLRNYNDAVELLERSIRLKGDEAGSWHNFAIALYMLGRHEQALLANDKALALAPDNAQIGCDRSLALLALGRLEQGLASYEVRWKVLKNSSIMRSGIREWQGESLTGKHILVHHEQGFGDTLMLCRFITYLSDAKKITLGVPPELVRLMEQSFPNISVIDWNSELDESQYDCHSPLLSVMRHIGIDTPSMIQPGTYLRAIQHGPIKLPDAKARIGLCWASGNHGAAFLERRRLLHLSKFLPLVELDDVALVSLQKGPGSEDILRQGLEGVIYDPMHRVEDFADTAALIACLDIVVTVDSAVAHLAGALGKHTIMLSPYTRCWRWWDTTSGLPWYNNMQQVHQSGNGSWDEAIGQCIGIVTDAVKDI